MLEHEHFRWIDLKASSHWAHFLAGETCPVGAFLGALQEMLCRRFCTQWVRTSICLIGTMPYPYLGPSFESKFQAILLGIETLLG